MVWRGLTCCQSVSLTPLSGRLKMIGDHEVSPCKMVMMSQEKSDKSAPSVKRFILNKGNLSSHEMIKNDVGIWHHLPITCHFHSEMAVTVADRAPSLL